MRDRSGEWRVMYIRREVRLGRVLQYVGSNLSQDTARSASYEMNKSETISFSILRVPGHTISAEDQEGMEEIGGRLRLLALRGPGCGPARPNPKLDWWCFGSLRLTRQ